MFDIGAAELLIIVVVAILVIGPKDMPLAMRTAGRWIGKIRRVSSHFRAGVDAMIREAELTEMEEKWKKQNAEIMARTGAGPIDHDGQMTGPPADAVEGAHAASAEAASAAQVEAAALARYDAREDGDRPDPDEPPLPFDRPGEPRG